MKPCMCLYCVDASRVWFHSALVRLRQFLHLLPCIWACYSPVDNNEKTPFFYYTRLRLEHGRPGGAANRDEDKSHTIPVGNDIYVSLPYTLTVKKKKKSSKKKKEKKEKRNRNRQSKNNQTKQNKEKNNLDVTPLGQSEQLRLYPGWKWGCVCFHEFHLIVGSITISLFLGIWFVPPQPIEKRAGRADLRKSIFFYQSDRCLPIRSSRLHAGTIFLPGKVSQN